MQKGGFHMRRKQKGNTNPICLGDWDYESGYAAGRIEATHEYRRVKSTGGYHKRLKLNISEKGTLYEEGRIKGYEETYIELMLYDDRTGNEQYSEDYNYDEDYYEDYDDGYDETDMSDEY